MPALTCDGPVHRGWSGAWRTGPAVERAASGTAWPGWRASLLLVKFGRMAARAVRRPQSEPFATAFRLYEGGQCLAAWEAGRVAGSLETWPGLEPRLLAGRIAFRVGAPRLGARLHLRAFRAYPDDLEAQYYYVWQVQQRRGAFAAWRERTRLAAPPAGDAHALADYHGQCAQILGSLRDFEAAETHLQLASEASADRPYWFVERAYLYELEDRYQEALASAERALAMNGQYPPGVASVARYLQLLNRSDAALDLLRRKAMELQSSDIAGLLVGVLLKLRLLDEAGAAVARFEELTPLRERDLESWLASTRAAIATYRGEYRSALEHLARADHPYHAQIVGNLRTFLQDQHDRAPRRVELPVAFVRQHHLTCTPATLSAISAFWSKPAEHLAVAEEICYDGTPAASERQWAEDHGWRAREFRVDWGSAAALIDRGVPFTLALHDVAAAHLQAVIGYDEPTGVLLVRDPISPDTTEINARELWEQQRAMGPRGMAMVPVEQSHLLDGVELPEANLYDVYYAMQRALDRHDRERAVELQREMASIAPGHRLTLTARSSLAGYDANPHEALEAIDALLEQFPHDQLLLRARLYSLRQVSSRHDRLTWLDRVLRRGAIDPLLLVEYAVELSADDRNLELAIWHVRRALRQRRDDAYAIHQLAGFYWRTDRREEATELYRFAACLDHPRELYAQRYFEVCRLQRQAELGLDALRKRVERWGSQSGAPAMTLFIALEALDRTAEAFAALDLAVRNRPEDGELRLFAAGQCARYARMAEAQVHRAAAAGRVKQVAWLAESAREARLQGNRAEALECWRAIVRIQPLDLAAQRAIAVLLSETSTRNEAVEHLKSCCNAFPHHAGLHHLLYEFTAGDPAIDRERVLRKLAEIDAADAWTQRELALNLLAQSRFEEALDLADQAVAMDRTSATSHAIKGHVLHQLGRSAKAAACFREALTRSADATDAIHGLLDTASGTAAGRKEVLEFVEGLLLEQAVFGDGLLAFRAAARGVLTPDELLAALRGAHERRPDLWHAWSALSQHLAEMGRTDEALEVAREATRRFPMIPRVWLDLSRVHHTRLEVEERIQALDRCRDLSPDWTEPILELCDAYEPAGRSEEGERLVESVLRRNPLDTALRAHLASLLQRRGEHDRAIEALRETLRINPDDGWAWHSLTEWSEARGQATAALDLARALAEARPGESHPWARLTNLQCNANRYEAALESADRALQANPRNVHVHDLKAAALASLRRFREAEEACHPPALGEAPPLALLGRSAWVDAQRGDHSRAIRRMGALLEGHPDYLWGWNQLVEWCAQQGDLKQAIRAAERLAWLDPGNVVPLGWLGDLKRRLGDRQGAMTVFERAMRLQPTYLFAGFQYFDLQCEQRDFVGVGRTLEILRLHAPPEQIQSARVRAAVARADMASSLSLMDQLCRNRDCDGQALSRAATAIADAGWSRQLERTLMGVLRGPAWHEATPALWARVRASRGRYGSLRRYRWLVRLGEPGKQAVYEMLTALGDRARREAGSPWVLGTPVRWQLFCIRVACRAWRRDDDTYWGSVGYALLCAGRLGSVIRWLRDWPQRPNARSWMLHNLVVALLNRRNDYAARAVLRHVARQCLPREAVDPQLKLWCVIGVCLDGDLALADRMLHETPEDVVRKGDRELRRFGVTLVAVLGDHPGRASLTGARREAIYDARDAYARDRAGLRLVRLAELAIARHARDRWMVVTAWARVHPWTSVILGITAAILLSFAFG